MERTLEVTKKVNAIQPASRAAGAVNGDAIDTADHDEVSYTLTTGAIDAGITGVDLKIQESADGSTGWADITGAAITSLDGDDDGAIPTIGIRTGGRAAGSRMRYQRPVLTVAGTGNALCGVTCDLTKPHVAPVTNTPASVLV